MPGASRYYAPLCIIAATLEDNTSKMETTTDTQPQTFDSFDLKKPLRDAIDKLGFEFCTPIQAESLVHTLAGHDVTGRAQTGTGKTAAFLITIINDLLSNPVEEKRYLSEPRTLIVAPTRELAIQIASDSVDLTTGCDLHTVTLVGGEDYNKQYRALDAKPVDIVVATPGRLLDFVQNDKLYLGLVELLVLDEADRMLDMGFIPQVRQVVSRTPKKDCRQTLLFSATFTPEIIELASRWAVQPIMVEVEPEHVAAEAVDQIVYLVTTANKYNLLFNIISEADAVKVLVFSNRRDQVRRLADDLYRNGINCGVLSGEIPQNKRVRTLEAFKAGKLQVLVATDVAGRGLHIENVTHVINYTLPEEADDYVHRIGRTGRAGAIGTSISFACEEDSFLLPAIEDKLGNKLDCIHPHDGLLGQAPGYVRESRFKARVAGGSSKARGRPKFRRN
jgi:ATP-dependent RNA helicase RhlB